MRSNLVAGCEHVVEGLAADNLTQKQHRHK